MNFEELHELYYSDAEHDKYHSFAHCASIHWTKEQCKTKIKSLLTCTCCKRHQLNRPTTMEEYIDSEKILYLWKKDTSCECSCRHYIRKLWYAQYLKDNKYEVCKY